MKKRGIKIMIMMVVILAASGGMGSAYGIFNPFSASDWKGLGSDIGTWFEDTWNKLKHIPECAKIVPLGSEWAAKKATYDIARTGLSVAQEILNQAKTLQTLDPHITLIRAKIAKLEGEKIATQGLKTAALGGVEAVKGLADATGALGEGFAILITRGINITRFELKARLDELSKGTLPMFGITAVIAGKKIDFELQLNLKDKPLKIAKDILIALAKAAKGIVG